MVKPVLLMVDDDSDVLRALGQDLRLKYGREYRVLPAEGGLVALKALDQLKLRNVPVALLLVDQRMPQMSGLEFIEQARARYPDAKRVLLTAYADTNAAIRAINTVQLDYYMVKPWEPPEQQVYPVLDDLLHDWTAHYRPPFDGIRVLGHRWSAHTHEIKDFLSRNQIPFRWLNIESCKEAQELLLALNSPQEQLPVVLFPDGTHLTAPSNRELAEKSGLRMRAEQPFYDLIIVGGGPAGLAAAVYGASEGLRTVLIEREAPGGQAGMSSRIENYLGFPVGLSGTDLARRAVAQAVRFGVEILAPQEATRLHCQDPYRQLVLGDGTELSCHAVLIATGVSYRKLDVPGIERLTGAGVYYGASLTEALACRDEDVYIVGGANSAGQAALFFSRYARTVTLIVRGEALDKSMSRYLVSQIEVTPNIVVLTTCRVNSVQGTASLESLTLINDETGESSVVRANVLFILIGALPRTDWVADTIARDSQGFLLAGPDTRRVQRQPRVWNLDREPMLLETSIPGVFVAGDVRYGSSKRVASSVGEGAIAVQLIHQYLSRM